MHRRNRSEGSSGPGRGRGRVTALAISRPVRAPLSAGCAAAAAILARTGIDGVSSDPATPRRIAEMPAMHLRVVPSSRRWRPPGGALIAGDAVPVARGR